MCIHNIEKLGTIHIYLVIFCPVFSPIRPHIHIHTHAHDHSNTLSGRFISYLPRIIPDRVRPVFMHVQFDNHADCWRACHALQRAIDERMLRIYPRSTTDPAGGAAGVTEPGKKPRKNAKKVEPTKPPESLLLFWTKTSYFKRLFQRASDAREQRKQNLLLQQQHDEHDRHEEQQERGGVEELVR